MYYRLWIMDYGLRFTAYGFWIIHYDLWITGYRLWITVYGLRVYFTGSYSLLQSKTQDNLFTGCSSHNPSYRLRFISICLLVMTCMTQYTAYCL